MSHNYQMFKCPVCKRLHPINLQAEDLDAAFCMDNEISKIKEFRGIENEDILTTNEWNFNKFDTRKKGYSNNAQLLNVRVNNPHPRRVKNW